jgi:hypothetical protein
MRSTPLDTHAAELLWSLWTEMGVNGVVRNHSWAAIDPEPLVLATPRAGVSDPRLIEEAGRWCANHADRLSVSRLEGLLESASETARIEFVTFARSLHDQTNLKWPVDKWRTKFAANTLTSGSNLRKRTKRASERVALPLRRPALFRLRMRALAGVGARADILSELVARANSWTSATDLQTLGYSKRNVARVLTELEEAAVVRIVRTGPGFRYRLDTSQRLAELVGPSPDAFPSWHEIFDHVVAALDLVQIGQGSSVSSRVESTALHATLAQTATTLWLDSPPPIRGHRDVPDDLTEWANRQLAALASGDSPAFRRPSSGRHGDAIEDEPRRSTPPRRMKRGRSRTVGAKAR